MAILKILYLPHPVLRIVGKTVTHFDANLHSLINDMFETMYDAKGVGLAAPQIGVSLQLAVVDVTPDKSQQLVLVNPKIIASEGEQEYSEGCLSVPGTQDKVIRASAVTIEAQDMYGKHYQMTADGLLGQCFQHEIDHLNGKLYIDKLSIIKRDQARKKMEKFLKAQ